MARGRALFSEHRRRAASVPVENLIYPDTTTANKLHSIRSDVAHDTDALLSASKRHDRDFLHRVQNSLANPPTFIKTPPTLNHNRARAPPPSRSAYYGTAAAASSVASSSASPELHRRTLYRPPPNRIDDYEVSAYLATPTRPPFVSRVRRASSVPPVLPSTATVPRWFPSSHVRGSSVPRRAPSTYGTYGSGRSYLQSHPDLEDIVVGVAPTTQYGDIVIGIPYRKQFMFDVQHGLDEIEDYPRIPVAPRVTSPYFAHRNSPSQLRKFEDADVAPYHFSRSRNTAPRYGTPSSVPWYPSYRQQPVSSSSAAPVRVSTFGRPARASSARRAADSDEYDLDLSGSKPPKDSFSNLRLRTSLVRDKVNEHKSMLDRYLPTEPHSRGSALTSSRGTSLDRRGTGGGYVGHQGASHSVPAPVLPAAPSGAISSRPLKPQISETRQKVRDLLCKSKKDPRYFD